MAGGRPYDEVMVDSAPPPEFLSVRQRPGMYFGSAGSGAQVVLDALVDNAVAEALVGQCDLIEVELTEDSIQVRDNGRGMSLAFQPDSKIPAVTDVMTRLNCRPSGDWIWHPQGGSHGIGLAPINAISRELAVVVCRDGGRWQQVFQHGVPILDVTHLGCSDDHGTTICCTLDPQIMNPPVPDFDAVAQRLRQLAYLVPGLRLRAKDPCRSVEYHYPGGLTDLVAQCTPIDTHRAIFHCRGADDLLRVEVALRWTASAGTRIMAFANTVANYDPYSRRRSSPEVGLRRGIKRAVQNWGLSQHPPRDWLKGKHIRAGLVAAVAVLVPEPTYHGSIKGSLSNPEVAQLVANVVADDLGRWLAAHPDEADQIAR